MMSPKRENLAYPRRGPLPVPLLSTLIKRRVLLQMIAQTPGNELSSVRELCDWKEQNGETRQFDPILEQALRNGDL